MKNFANPDLVKSLPFGERLIDSLIVTVLGMCITFIVLTLLMYAIRIMSSALGVGERKKQAKQNAAKAAASKAQAPAGASSAESKEDDGELIAVLTAAVTAASGGAKKLIIHSYRQVGQSLSTWSKVGVDKMIKK